ncbi:hypothetical protein GWK47_031402 [Chionoecetes opilio]|uniref:Platelet-derived growth factor (PDGF) family profile domain-containing protein n=1 Tax=Chionoecetes opilio TaxID=41210 RepID=A0A8J4YKD5_CHIOP|nr:hypothetical protein GWK47_031402 [Chionoecetes opilio]
MTSSVNLLAVMAAAMVMVLQVAGLPAMTVLETDDAIDFKHYLQVQHEELKALSCQPKPGKVTIRNELKYHDSLIDETFYPEVVSVSRCWETCSFCGNIHLGVRKGRCLPDPESIVKRPYYVFYFTGNKRVFRRVMLTEHTSCKCS